MASILFFPLVLRIEFKSPEELKLQPKTHEEHLATQNESDHDDEDDDDDDDDDDEPRESVEEPSEFNSNEYSHIRFPHENEQRTALTISNDISIEFLLENKDNEREMIEMKTLPRITTNHNNYLTRSNSNMSNMKQAMTTPLDDPSDGNLDSGKKIEPLESSIDHLSAVPSSPSTISVTQRFYEFYNAPITKFWYNALFYLIFLFLFTFMVLVQTPARPSVAGKNEFHLYSKESFYFFIEYLVTLYLASSALDTAREVNRSFVFRFFFSFVSI